MFTNRPPTVLSKYKTRKKHLENKPLSWHDIGAKGCWMSWEESYCTTRGTASFEASVMRKANTVPQTEFFELVFHFSFCCCTLLKRTFFSGFQRKKDVVFGHSKVKYFHISPYPTRLLPHSRSGRQYVCLVRVLILQSVLWLSVRLLCLSNENGMEKDNVLADYLMWKVFYNAFAPMEARYKNLE